MSPCLLLPHHISRCIVSHPSSPFLAGVDVVQGCSDLMPFIVSSGKSALLGLWRALLGHQPLSPWQPCALMLLAPFACVYT